MDDQLSLPTDRVGEISRSTSETSIKLRVDLDGQGRADIQTGIPFFDHMLELFARHGLFDLRVHAEGDIAVDYHHTVEDVGIVLGQAIKAALGDKRGIQRYGFFLLPMDETLVRVVVDLSNRPIFIYRVETSNLMVRDFNISLVREFFQGLTNALGANWHMQLEYGSDPHHIAEALFKCAARALDAALRVDPRALEAVPSTKGLL